MKAVTTPRLIVMGVLAACVVGLSTGSAVAQSFRNDVTRARSTGPSGPAPKVVSKSHQPVGTPHKASSYAPHPTKRRVFGDPIQAPIVHNVPPEKPAPK
jgi:hypothetical protein